jgi:hypothetical protein
METINVFETLNKIDVKSKVEKKKNLTYLSWAWAWAEVKKKYPLATYEIFKDEQNKPYIYDEKLGYMCFTKVTIEDETLEMWLPVMDGANKAMKDLGYTYTTKFGDKKVEPASMFDINKTIMRCLVKNLAMFGMALYIYAGEDLPEEPEKDCIKLLNDCKDLKELGNVYTSLTTSQKVTHETLKNELKTKLK